MATAKRIKTAKKTIKKIRKKAKKVNKRVAKAQKRLVKTNKKFAASALDAVNDRIEGIDVTENVIKAKNTAKEVSDFALKTSNEMVEDGFENSKRTLALTEKAVKGGLKLAERQQQITFDALETAKEQLTDSAQRLRKLFS